VSGSLVRMSTLLSTVIVRAAEEGGEHGASHLLSYGVGALTLVILLGLLVALLAFGAGREHS
jgi:cytochrome c biogenesis protein CcdA